MTNNNPTISASATSDKITRVALGMSGGVDSSAAALILKEQGYDVCAITLLLCPDASPYDQNVTDAKTVCDTLNIEHHVIDLRNAFAETVISDFVSEYSRGRTPNPCIVCNRTIKFGAMLRCAQELGCDKVATGHYARIITDANGHPRIAKDISPKDQSYVLWSLTQSQLEHIILPISGYSKDQLREMVRLAGLPIFSKPDSQDICFIPDGDYVGFLGQYANLTPVPGNFVDRSGNVIGKHKGTICYTVGQRKGLGGGFAEPMYVVRLDPEHNEITLGGEGSQYSSHALLEQVNFQTDINCRQFSVTAKHRYSAPPAEAVITIISATESEIQFTSPQRALTPGQSAVFYDGDMLVGGGIISKIL